MALGYTPMQRTGVAGRSNVNLVVGGHNLVGVWGSGRYSGDFAKDLRSTVRALAHLPFESDKLVEILVGTEAVVARNPEDEEHTVFWLVLADQFAQIGIPSEPVKDKALRIIDEGGDLAMLAKLGMATADLNHRRKVLAELRSRLTAATASRRRTTLKKPQTLLMETGDAFVYPSGRGNCINPYFASKDRMPGGWHADGWNATVIVERGLAFDFLAWYRPLVLGVALATKPDINTLFATQQWFLSRPGTCSASHFKKMELERVGRVEVDQGKLLKAFPDMASGTSAAVRDISIANGLSLVRSGGGRNRHTIASLTTIAAVPL